MASWQTSISYRRQSKHIGKSNPETFDAHNEPSLQIPLFFKWLRWLIPSWQPGASKQHNLGYSADVWLDASLEVFDVLDVGKTY
ncbi:MAG: hypothetical protein CM1200mP6_00800 [Anaerolineaceae bacterium]|nr:MAG: hypothetical protein CM1200mP6_00800 [Anaerolineaceae bacterium]